MKSSLLSLVLFFSISSLIAAAPNFVWIIADDMSPDTGAYGLKDVSTPNLDRLAAEGRRYTRAYASAPVCSASRSAFILGCYQTTTGLHPHDAENPQPLMAPYRHLPGLLRDAGWFVTNAPAPGGLRNGKLIKKAKTHYNFKHDAAEMYDGDDWRKRKPGQPFFAQFQIPEPHRPFPIPESYDEAKLNAIQIPPNYPDHPLIRRDWYAYQRSVEMVDHRVGVILDQLKEEEVLDNTVVMFFADHGRPMPWGKQWLSVEGLQVPLIMRGPGIEANSVENRLVSLIDLAPSMLQLVGLPIPTWMEGRAILRGEFPERSTLFAARDRCGDAMDRIRAVIGTESLLVRNFQPSRSRLNWSGYKEASYPGMPLLRVLSKSGGLNDFQAQWLTPTRPEIEFYDLKTDPQGLHNIAGEPAVSTKIESMRAAMDTWIQTSPDRGAQGDPVTEPPLATIQKEKRADYQRTWKARLKKAEPTDAERVAWWMQAYGLPAKDPIP
ncbi:sulfatase [Prosthecobacter sp.]|uniref:sulfatase family protein n=1 Tax=Prosthecobacter sp. TaxID=1965333 RepID=UPI001D63286E|nr:sulfatase [Prosthecobacter sp.]MCB1278670.1 sulfatase [Prosthecobacter sp.]